jgi:hypothetical protein
LTNDTKASHVRGFSFYFSLPLSMSEFAKQYEPKISEAQSQALWKKAEVSLPKE